VGAGADARGLTPGSALEVGVYHAGVTRSLPERLAAIATGLAAAVVVIAIAILPFLTPAWVSFEQGRARALAWTGYDGTELTTATNAILHDLVLGPPTFDVEVAGAPVLEERERAHMRDVRGVFAGFYAIALVAAVGLVALVVGARRAGHPDRAWRAIAAGMRGLAVGVVVAGIVSTFFFDQAFELFHELFFPSGSYTFDPRTDRLVQLFPFDFWSETTMVLGGVILAIAAVIWLGAGRLGRQPTQVAAADDVHDPRLAGASAADVSR
jgi:integral membrane protein (TIGR01906 family)